ncbi:MAG: hypothetical protein ACK6CP_12770 [Pseudanabaena sp.]|jgi:hypothetical protein|uniref:hypothetical protein n=1 Tax=Microcystis sp. M57BS1 TaxID=2771200 RepID=UPI002586715A|nr:hypothetical protein [Microcystis sp. M57BS1]
MNKLPFPETQSDRIPIAFDQYLEYTPEKLELWDGFLQLWRSRHDRLSPSSTNEYGTTHSR